MTWAADFMYVPTHEGWPFQAVVVDMFSGRIVGWAMSAAMTSRLFVDALDVAVSRRGPATSLVAHPDRASQSAGDPDRSGLSRRGMVCRTSGVGHCRDNAVVESTFGRIKREVVRHETYATLEEARASIFEDVEVFDHRVRRHSTLGYVAPAEYERTHNPNHRI